MVDRPAPNIVDVITAELAAQYPLNLAETEFVGQDLGSVVYRGRGGTNVLKFERRPFRDTVETALADGCSLGEADRQLGLERTESVNRWRTRYGALEDYFAGHVVPTQIALTTVMVSGDVLLQAPEAARVGVVAGDTYAFTTYLRRQPYVAVAADESRLSLHGSHAELTRDLDPDAYAAMSRALLPASQHDRALAVDFGMFAALHGAEPITGFADSRRGLLRLIPAMRVDSALRESVHDFIVRAHRLVRERDEIVDIMGEDNVVFFRHDGRWDWLLIDPLLSFEVAWREHLQLITQVDESTYLGFWRASRFEYVLNATRTHNMVAHELGAPEFLLDLPVTGMGSIE